MLKAQIVESEADILLFKKVSEKIIENTAITTICAVPNDESGHAFFITGSL